MIRVTVWNEFQHERTQEKVKEMYPDGVRTWIAKFLSQEEELSVRTAVFDEEEHGLTEEVLANTDVLVFWNHMLQEEFSDDVAERVRRHVLAGMGLVVLHSGHYSKIMRKLLGTSMTLRWRHGDRERLFCTCPTHPIAQGIPAWVDIPEEEMYGEFFDIPKPDDVVFTGWFAGGEVFRSECTYTRGQQNKKTGQNFLISAGTRGIPHLPYAGDSEDYQKWGALVRSCSTKTGTTG